MDQVAARSLAERRAAAIGSTGDVMTIDATATIVALADIDAQAARRQLKP